jgi:hypothetical protein
MSELPRSGQFASLHNFTANLSSKINIKINNQTAQSLTASFVPFSTEQNKKEFKFKVN